MPPEAIGSNKTYRPTFTRGARSAVILRRVYHNRCYAFSMPDDDGTLSGDTIATALAQPQSTPAHTRFRLSVIDGPDAGTSFVVDASSSPRVYVGQGPSCEFRLTDDR